MKDFILGVTLFTFFACLAFPWALRAFVWFADVFDAYGRWVMHVGN